MTIAVTTGDQKSVSHGPMEDGLNTYLILILIQRLPHAMDKTLTGIEKGSRN